MVLVPAELSQFSFFFSFFLSFISFGTTSFPFPCFCTVQGVPLIQSVPRGERVAMISQAQIREFREGEYIIKQGEVGEELFIILEGACDVVEDKNITKSSSKDDKDKLSIKDKEKEKDKDGKEIEKVPNIVKLVTLREGHFFGEMSLMSVSTTRLSVYLILCLSNSVELNLSVQ